MYVLQRPQRRRRKPSRGSFRMLSRMEWSGYHVALISECEMSLNDFELLFCIIHFEKYSRHHALYLNMQMTDKSK